MGSVAFELPPELSPREAQALARATLAGGYDHAPSPVHAHASAQQLILAREPSESGYLMVPWPDPAGGETVILSATLRERAEPYHPIVELARGWVNQIRAALADWHGHGFVLAEADQRTVLDLARRFGRAAVNQDLAMAREVLALSAPTADRIAGQFANWLLDIRLGNQGPLNTRLGLRLAKLPAPDARSAIAASFNAVRLVPNWASLEATQSQYNWSELDALVDWADAAGLRISIGPLIDLAHSTFPDWVYQWQGDLPSLAAFFSDFTESVMNRYRSRVRSWQVVAGFNHADRFKLGEDDRLRLAARVMDTARNSAPDADFTIGLAQPWGDYLASDDYTYSPLVFADTLIRAGFPMTAIELELLHNPVHSGQSVDHRTTAPRDAIAVYRLCELFTVLSIPLELTFGRPLNSAGGPQVSEAISLALSLPQVRAVYWESWADDVTDRVTGAGLATNTEQARALKRRLRDLRLRYLA